MNIEGALPFSKEISPRFKNITDIFKSFNDDLKIDYKYVTEQKKNTAFFESSSKKSLILFGILKFGQLEWVVMQGNNRNEYKYEMSETQPRGITYIFLWIKMEIL